MTREEKNLLSRQKIIDSAIAEFGTKSYAESSLNEICKNGKISKGIIYHYFKNKDELYLVCVKECFDSLTNFLNSKKISFNHVEEDIKKYLDMRQKFFNENPYFSNIFTSALLQPPKHLIGKIGEIKTGLDELNINYYAQALQNVDFKSDVSRDEAIEYFIIFHELFNNYYQNKIYDDYKALVHDHELKLSKLLKIMLYGIAKEKKE